MLLYAWFKAFVLTQLIEMPLYVYTLSKALNLPIRPFRFSLSTRLILIAFGASAITHPFVWFIFPRALISQPYWLYFLTAESFAVIVEAWYLKFFGVSRFLAWSLLINGLSAGLGLLIYY